VYDQRQLIESLAITIAKKINQMSRLSIMGAPGLRGMDITKFIHVYECFQSRTGTDLAAENIIATFHFSCSEPIQVLIEVMSGYLRKDWEQL
jgi:hypothetical protein